MSFSELLILMVIALILFGPEDLPDVARAVGRIVYEVKKMTNEMTKEFQDAVNAPSNVMNKAYEEAIKPALQEKESSHPVKESDQQSSESLSMEEGNAEPQEVLLTYDDEENPTPRVNVQKAEEDPLAELPPDVVSYTLEKKDASR